MPAVGAFLTFTVTIHERMHMRTRLRSVSAFVIVAAVVALAATYTVKAAPQSAPAVDPMPALLAEVHALRIAMEQSTTVGPRVQLTLARLNIEEQRLAQLSAQLDQVRRELNGAALESQKFSDRIPEIEKSIQIAPDDKTRRMSEAELAVIKREASARNRQEQQLRTRENEVAQALNNEQGRWMEVNARLDELERLLGPVPR
jgi:chromosome segregation ATPase